jgi:hypothetical protein
MNVAWVRRAVGQINALFVEVLQQFNDSAARQIDHSGPDTNPRVSDVTTQIRALENGAPAGLLPEEPLPEPQRLV